MHYHKACINHTCCIYSLLLEMFSIVDFGGIWEWLDGGSFRIWLRISWLHQERCFDAKPNRKLSCNGYFGRHKISSMLSVKWHDTFWKLILLCHDVTTNNALALGTAYLSELSGAAESWKSAKHPRGDVFEYIYG